MSEIKKACFGGKQAKCESGYCISLFKGAICFSFKWYVSVFF